MSDFLDYLDEIYEELVEEFGHEIEAKCEHNHIQRSACRIVKLNKFW